MRFYSPKPRFCFHSFIGAAAITVCYSIQAFAASIPSDASNYTNPEALLSTAITNPLVKTAGLAAAHRPMDPATPLGSSLGLDVGLQINATKIPNDFWASGELAGVSKPSNADAFAIPLPRLILHKGIGSNFGLGVSVLAYSVYHVYGADLKYSIVSEDEEGPAFAVRLCYTAVKLGMFQTTDWSPQILMSKKLSFADPYIGVQYTSIKGSVTIPIHIAKLNKTYVLKTEGSGTEIGAFMGVRFFFETMGLELTLEGSYSNAGADSLGLKFGLAL